ncbi:hypothetical protein JTE90_007382 [Oedothorax gibbosus]|uniref:Glucose-methanol-choline oxidoreductase N-terminal domain-containing protein n=1 Tax=Oedothorax gibbosus TaxID=931172 RepID=A0AAV6TRU7_9ARAC|nr:hypothetical protein JTE90_007382 [Oedothorax gibbosus]
MTAFAKAASERDYRYRGIDGAKKTGTIRNGRRCSTAIAFLIPAQDRKNLHIFNNAHVTKMLINSRNVAYGVRFDVKGKLYEVEVRKEVIFCGGTVNSPQIPMLSGIGPKEHLRSLSL